MRRAILLSSLAVTSLALTPASAEACRCRVAGPPCEEAWKSPLIFVGTVIEIDQQPRALGPRRVRLRITEALRGTEKGEIDIHLRGGGGPSCDPPFRLGEAWLVYANNRWEGGAGWTASSCSRTRLLKQAAEDLAYLRLPDARKPPSHISGRVTRHVYDLSGGRGQTVPVSGVPVTVKGTALRAQAKTDSDGRYSIPVETSGTFHVEFARYVDGFSIRSGGEVTLPHYRACAVVNASATYDGRVSGRILDDRGRPVPFLPITLASSPRLLQQHMLTDAEGRFAFAEVYPAAHDVVPSMSLWEGERALPPITAAPVSVAPAARIDMGALRLPSSIKTTLVEIQIEDSTGKPAVGASVNFRLPEGYGRLDYPPKADEAGVFRVSVVSGQRYRVEAGYVRKAQNGTAYEVGEMVFAAAGQPIRLRLAPSR